MAAARDEPSDDVAEEVQQAPEPEEDATDGELLGEAADPEAIVFLRLMLFALLALLALFLGGVLIGRADLSLESYGSIPRTTSAW